MPALSAPVRLFLGRNAAFLLLALLVAACDNPFSEDGGKPGAANPDSLDAELGKNQLNKYDFQQGNILSTGEVMDLAIQGHGFFILRNQDHLVYFRRPADFIQDEEGALHLGNAQVRLQGIRLFSEKDPYPSIPSDSLPGAALKDLVDIRLPLGDLAPPRATTVVKLARNLDSDSRGKGSLAYTQKFMHHAEGIDIAMGLFDRQGNELGIRAGDVLSFSAVSGGATVTATLTATSTTTLADITNAMTSFLRRSSVDAGLGTTVDLVTAADSETLRGALAIYGNTTAINNLQVTSNRPVSGPKLTKAFSVPTLIPALTARLGVVTDALRSPAQPADLLAEVYDATGNGLGLDDGDLITYSGKVGDDNAQNVTATTYAAGTTTLQHLIEKIKDNFKLPERDGTLQNNLSVSLNPAGTDDNIPDGSIVIRGQPERAFDIKAVSIMATDFNNSQPRPNFFNTNMNATALRSATDHQVGTCSMDVHDGSGKLHRLSLRFIPTAIPGSWLWEATMGDGAVLRAGSRGTVTFGGDGSVAAFATEAGDARLEFDPGNGADRVVLRLDAGGPRDFTGLTQYRIETSVAMISQDGFPAGKLLTLAIGENGLVTGAYSNGQSRALYRIPLADFQNPRGLRQVGDHSFLESPESGKPALSTFLDPAVGAIRSGALEYRSEAERSRICDLTQDCD